MCGIIGYIGKEEKATNIIMEGLAKLEYRGYDSAGIAVFTPSGICIERKRADCPIWRSTSRRSGSRQGYAGIGHTRWATHGEPSDINAHPHCSMDRSVVVVHNGIIENYAQLRDQLAAQGSSFVSETDTEILANGDRLVL